MLGLIHVSEHLVERVLTDNYAEKYQMLCAPLSDCAHAPRLLSPSLLAKFVTEYIIIFISCYTIHEIPGFSLIE